MHTVGGIDHELTAQNLATLKAMRLAVRNTRPVLSYCARILEERRTSQNLNASFVPLSSATVLPFAANPGRDRIPGYSYGRRPKKHARLETGFDDPEKEMTIQGRIHNLGKKIRDLVMPDKVGNISGMPAHYVIFLSLVPV